MAQSIRTVEVKVEVPARGELPEILIGMTRDGNVLCADFTVVWADRKVNGATQGQTRSELLRHLAEALDLALEETVP